MKQLCNLQVDVQLQENGKFDVYISNEGNSGSHYTDVTADKIGELVAEEIEIRAEEENPTEIKDKAEISDHKEKFLRKYGIGLPDYMYGLQPKDHAVMNKEKLAEIYNCSDIDSLLYMYGFCEGEYETLCEQIIALNQEDMNDLYYNGKWKLLNHFGIGRSEQGDAYVEKNMDGCFIRDAEFITYWDINDTKSKKITTHCKVNTKTREVFDIEKSDVDVENCVLVRECVAFDGKEYLCGSANEKTEGWNENTDYWYR